MGFFDYSVEKKLMQGGARCDGRMSLREPVSEA